jgi:hypothetical protein
MNISCACEITGASRRTNPRMMQRSVNGVDPGSLRHAGIRAVVCWRMIGSSALQASQKRE